MKGTNMGKKSYTNGNFSINGETKASTYKKGNTVYTNYNMSDTEKKIFDYAQNSFLNSLPQLNVFSDETKNQFKNQMEAYKNQGIKNIESIYTPMINNLKTDVASRFGNYDNSSFLSELKDIENSRSDAISSFAQDMILKENDLVNDELSRRYNYMNFLSGIQDQTYSNALNFGSASSANSSYGSSSSSSNSLAAFSAIANQALSLLKYFY